MPKTEYVFTEVGTFTDLHRAEKLLMEYAERDDWQFMRIEMYHGNELVDAGKSSAATDLFDLITMCINKLKQMLGIKPEDAFIPDNITIILGVA